MFIANDPHIGGGLHPQDVMVQRPIYLGDRRVAWVVISAHLMDLGGMVVGSFAPEATECYQEALRLPPVRLFRRGEEVTDVWDIFRNNVRLDQLVEMDLRGLVAGCHVAQERVESVVSAVGDERFVESLRALRDLSEAEMRARIGQLEDGTYRVTSWTEFDETFFSVPCRLTVDGDRLVFDFDGASPQTTHFFNSKPYIIESELVAMLAGRIARDLPYNDGIFAPIELRCPEGTIVNARPPAPIAAAHMHVALNAANVALDCVKLAMGASADAPGGRFLTGTGFESGLGNQVWAWTGPDGNADAYMVLDGNWVGGSGGTERDGLDLGRNLVGAGMEGMFTDIEILESWYPLLFREKRARRGVDGAGAHRAGGGNQMTFEPHGIDQMFGTMFGMRRWLPLEGAAGGLPGACNEFLVHHDDGSVEQVDVNTSGIVVRDGERFQMRLANGGGFGDPLERDPEAVRRDVAVGRFDASDAERVYGVVVRDGVVDTPGTDDRRAAIRRARLSAATPPARAVTDDEAAVAVSGDGTDMPLTRASSSAGRSPTPPRASPRWRWRPRTGPTAARSSRNAAHPRGHRSSPGCTSTRAPAAASTSRPRWGARPGRSRSARSAGRGPGLEAEGARHGTPLPGRLGRRAPRGPARRLARARARRAPGAGAPARPAAHRRRGVGRRGHADDPQRPERRRRPPAEGARRVVLGSGRHARARNR